MAGRQLEITPAAGWDGIADALERLAVEALGPFPDAAPERFMDAPPHEQSLPNRATQCSSRLAGVFWILASNRQDTAARPKRRISSRSK